MSNTPPESFLRSWWMYLPAIAISVGVGVHRHWDSFSLVLIGLAVFLSCLRFILPLFRGSVARKMAQMSPEERERLLNRCPPEERMKLQKEIDEHAAANRR